MAGIPQDRDNFIRKIEKAIFEKRGSKRTFPTAALGWQQKTAFLPSHPGSMGDKKPLVSPPAPEFCYFKSKGQHSGLTIVNLTDYLIILNKDIYTCLSGQRKACLLLTLLRIPLRCP